LQIVYDSLKLAANDKKINLSFNCALPENEAIIRTDSEKFYGILSNLVKNAIKYTDSGTIEFGYANKEKEFEFYVKDTGIGIPKAMQEAIFVRFIQADIRNKMARQGAGLGLAITRAYVEILGGRIWVESEEGIGSTFYFNLPHHTKISKNQVSRNQSSKKEDKTQVKEFKILIVEDDETSTALIIAMLRRFRNVILKAKNGLDAVNLCRLNPDIDIVLMDIQMPIMNGFNATKQIRQFNKEIIIIAQTAFALAGDREKALQAGCNDYLAKPINREMLIEKIFKHLKDK